MEGSEAFQEHLRALGHRSVPSSTSRRIRRDEIASRLVRYRDGHGDDWADIIDMLTMHPEARRKVARLLGEIEAAANRQQEICETVETRRNLSDPLKSADLRLSPFVQVGGK